MRNCVAISARVLSLLLGHSANAADVIYGIGNKSCGAYVEARRHNTTAALYFGNWLTGFLSAVNFENASYYPNILEGTDIEGAMLWLENHCRSHPTEAFGIASMALTNAQLRANLEAIKKGQMKWHGEK
jgi:hypothetical protein